MGVREQEQYYIMESFCAICNIRNVFRLTSASGWYFGDVLPLCRDFWRQ